MKTFLKVFGGIHTALYRATGGGLGGQFRGAPILLLTVKGRKTGKHRTIPLMYGRDGDGLVLVASLGGAPHNPAWYWNLQGRKADVQVGREHRTVKAREAEGEERDRLFQMMVGVFPPYADYAKKTSRRIPVLVLEPVT